MRLLLIAVAFVATACIAFGGERFDGKDPVPTVWTTNAKNPATCTTCNTSTTASYENPAALEFLSQPAIATGQCGRSSCASRSRGFVSTVIQNRPRLLGNFIARGAIMRLRR